MQVVVKFPAAFIYFVLCAHCLFLVVLSFFSLLSDKTFYQSTSTPEVSRIGLIEVRLPATQQL